MMFTGRDVLADKAERIGLVSKVVPDGQTVDAAIEIAIPIANSPFGVQMTKASCAAAARDEVSSRSRPWPPAKL